MTNVIESAECSDVGRVRKTNEDACLRMPEAGVYCVADGMGGAVDGEVASRAIVDHIHRMFDAELPLIRKSLSSYQAAFEAAANQASQWIRHYAKERQIGQMGSTLVGIVFDPVNPARAVGLHAGDSRLYRWRGGVLTLLTCDHTAGNALLASSGRDPASIPSRYHNELVRAVGLKESVDLDMTPLDVKAGDHLLICSDGLSRMLSEEQLTVALKHAEKLVIQEAARWLVAEAVNAGGRDNVTVVLIRVEDVTEPFSRMDGQETHATQGGAEDARDLYQQGTQAMAAPSQGVSTVSFGTDEEGLSGAATEGREALWYRARWIQLLAICSAVLLLTMSAAWFQPELRYWWRHWTAPRFAISTHDGDPHSTNADSTVGAPTHSGTMRQTAPTDTAAASRVDPDSPEVIKLDVEMECLMVRFAMVEARSSRLRFEEARNTKRQEKPLQAEEQETMLSRVAQLEADFRAKGLIDRAERGKTIEELRLRIQNKVTY